MLCPVVAEANFEQMIQPFNQDMEEAVIEQADVEPEELEEEQVHPSPSPHMRPEPLTPSPEERARHRLCHLPSAQWCTECDGAWQGHSTLQGCSG